MDTAVAIETATEIMLDSTADAAGFVSDVSGKIALGAATVGQSEVASVAAAISTLSGGIEATTLVGKAVLTREAAMQVKQRRDFQGLLLVIFWEIQEQS
jgi:hypothetical protein